MGHTENIFSYEKHLLKFDRWLNVRSRYTFNSKIKEIKVVIKVDGLEVCYLHGIQIISFQFLAGIYSSLI